LYRFLFPILFATFISPALSNLISVVGDLIFNRRITSLEVSNSMLAQFLTNNFIPSHRLSGFTLFRITGNTNHFLLPIIVVKFLGYLSTTETKLQLNFKINKVTLQFEMHDAYYVFNKFFLPKVNN